MMKLKRQDFEAAEHVIEIQKGPKVEKKDFVHKLHWRSSDLSRGIYFFDKKY